MPLYEYECGNCETSLELLVRSQTEKVECPECGDDKKLTRLMSATAAPNMNGASRSLPVAGESCDAPRCCGGFCDT